MHCTLGIITHDMFSAVTHSTCIMSISQLVQCSFGINLHFRQTRFGGSCIQSRICAPK